MKTALRPWIDAFAGLEVTVIGEAMLDTYLEGTSGRLCREAPVPIVALSGRRDAPGGAANTAANARALGAKVRLISVVGDDPEGAVLRRLLADRGVIVDELLADPGRTTLAKNRVVAGSQLLVRFDQGSTGPIGPEAEEHILRRLAEAVPRSDAVIISDYGYGILTPRVVAALASLQAEAPRVMVADSKDLAAYRAVGLSAVKPNFGEAAPLLGLDPDEVAGPRAERVALHGARLLEATGARIAAVTLDTEGALVFERGRPPYRTFARPAPHARAAGAGDTFLAAMALGLAAGADAPAAAELASAAAAVVVGRDGTAACNADDLRDRLDLDRAPRDDRARLADFLDDCRRLGRRIVFTNGCFDILHRGHVTYLNRARALGDVLVVGVNSDAGIRRLKGPGRPINTLEDRVQVLEALSCVDFVVPFDDDVPFELIRAVRPDVFVKGGDYTRERLPEAGLVERLGGVVEILPLVADRSTTNLIERIRVTVGDGVPALVASGQGGGR
ncbi:MAG TPA: D-glycero-beta-D-manno-heptose 1-phosphate adenylyltransferase [Isosphaeraceae bacterium]|jgi:D-beta-D-heptose 7-phosphate kinase/D-beta-D-heptose 1-phosphate adenosyltransferase|nr:D-glycero-beta-D-manno-heptose 1-phosphate adenylyltransferase [Isosphaeraceae bacterium]